MTTVSALTSTDLIRVLFGSSAFQMLNAGCSLGLFPLLDRLPGSTSAEIADALDLQTRPAEILLLGTTSLGLTVREDGRYRNADLLTEMFDSDSWDIIEDLVTFESEIVLPVEVDFVESLRQNTNVGLRRFDGEGGDLYHRLAANPGAEQLFYRCMRSWSRLSNPILIDKADLTGVRRVLDVGGGDAVNAIALARANPGVEFTVLDLPGAVEIARKKVAESNLTEVITVLEGDIFADEYPRGHDCVLFANQLVIWSPEENESLLRKACEALSPGGRVMVFSAMADDSGDGPLYAALDNVYFATLPAKSSTIYRWGQYETWLRAAGFSTVERHPGRTWTPHGLISGTK
ncbi:O-methyltransferase, family 2 [Alloactinosynnema sp. L-07]|uniref:methyltransferase n=1 Tax=Alloactinosynnema sp. L-07 TaxID=1653480 RepID=UPI00065F05DD|nr:methyltransferase [Alloactinosynnema sp. L-07]CRK56714.1 O-methyltransferase, family 2 [Alloactinosynnema sp. L-07]